MKHKEEKKLDSSYDGIEEYDNLPPYWWMGLLAFCIIFGLVYMGHYVILGTGDSQVVEYEKQMNPDYIKKEVISEVSFTGLLMEEYGHRSPYLVSYEDPTPLQQSEIQKYLQNPFEAQILGAMYAATDGELETLKKAFPRIYHYYLLGYKPASLSSMMSSANSTEKDDFLADVESLSPLSDAGSLEKGKAIFERECFTCHGKLGEGGIGPNMTDDYWIHGGDFPSIVTTITKGVPAKGMISWEKTLSKDDIVNVASFLLTLQGTNPPNAKAPQGEKMTIDG